VGVEKIPTKSSSGNLKIERLMMERILKEWGENV
jgi:hypothetical protein